MWELDQFFEGDDNENKFYYHTSKTRELDNLLGDIYHKILGMFHFLIISISIMVMLGERLIVC